MGFPLKKKTTILRIAPLMETPMWFPLGNWLEVKRTLNTTKSPHEGSTNHGLTLGWRLRKFTRKVTGVLLGEFSGFSTWGNQAEFANFSLYENLEVLGPKITWVMMSAIGEMVTSSGYTMGKTPFPDIKTTWRTRPLSHELFSAAVWCCWMIAVKTTNQTS